VLIYTISKATGFDSALFMSEAQIAVGKRPTVNSTSHVVPTDPQRERNCGRWTHKSGVSRRLLNRPVCVSDHCLPAGHVGGADDWAGGGKDYFAWFITARASRCTRTRPNKVRSRSSPLRHFADPFKLRARERCLGHRTVLHLS
jgi:hypothetical protein